MELSRFASLFMFYLLLLFKFFGPTDQYIETRSKIFHRTKVSRSRTSLTMVNIPKGEKTPLLKCNHEAQQVWLPHEGYECKSQCMRPSSHTAISATVTAYQVMTTENHALVCTCQASRRHSECIEDILGEGHVSDTYEYFDMTEVACSKVCDSEKMWTRSVGSIIVSQEQPTTVCEYWHPVITDSLTINIRLQQMQINFNDKGIPYLALPNTFQSCAYQAGWCNPYHGTTLVWKPQTVKECSLKEFFKDNCSILTQPHDDQVLISCPNEKSQFALSHIVDDHCQYQNQDPKHSLVQTVSGVVLSVPSDYTAKLHTASTSIAESNTQAANYLLENIVSQTNAVFDEICYRLCEADARLQTLNQKENLPTFYYTGEHILKVFPAKSGSCVVSCQNIYDWTPLEALHSGLVKVTYQLYSTITSTEIGLMNPITLEILSQTPLTCHAELGVVIPGKDKNTREVWNGTSVHLLPRMNLNLWSLGGVHFSGFIPLVFPPKHSGPSQPPLANYTESGDKTRGNAESTSKRAGSWIGNFFEKLVQYWKIAQWIYIIIITILLVAGIIAIFFWCSPQRILLSLLRSPKQQIIMSPGEHELAPMNIQDIKHQEERTPKKQQRNNFNTRSKIPPYLLRNHSNNNLNKEDELEKME